MEPADIGWLYKFENDTNLWQCGNRTQPLSRADIAAFVEHSDLDLYQTRQLRLMIDKKGRPAETVGAIDVFCFDPFHLHASVGILITKEWQGQGLATEALNLFVVYLHSTFGIRAVEATTAANNQSSQKLFERCGFKLVGIRPLWLRQGEAFIDELVLIRNAQQSAELR